MPKENNKEKHREGTALDSYTQPHDSMPKKKRIQKKKKGGRKNKKTTHKAFEKLSS